MVARLPGPPTVSGNRASQRPAWAGRTGPVRLTWCLKAALLGGLLTGAFSVSACGPEGDPSAAAAPVPDADGRLLGPAHGRTRPNVLLVVIDTLRADALAPVGEGAEPMPHLARRARSGVQFRGASAASSWTLPSLTTLLTGRLPAEHGIEGEEGLAQGLAPMATWAETLGRGLGYETVAWVGGPWTGGHGSMLEGFDDVSAQLPLSAAPALVTSWSRRRDPTRPFFLLLHAFEAHDPYGEANHRVGQPAVEALDRGDPFPLLGPEPDGPALTRAYVLDARSRQALLDAPEARQLMPAFLRYIWSGWRARPDPALAAELREAYGGGVRWVDGLLEQALRAFEGAGLLRDTLLIVTGDHGEAFGEHGLLLHGRHLYDELLRVPLVVSGPAPFDRPAAPTASVGLADLFPTVLELVGLAPPPGLAGRSLVPLLEGGGEGRPVRAQVARRPAHTGGESDAELESVRSARWKFIVTYDRLAGTVTEEAYDLLADPEERRDRADAHHRVQGLPFDDAFCRAVERARDRIWALAALHGVAPAGAAAAPRPPSSCASGSLPR